MKQCPECSAKYEDEVNFCLKDGRSLVATSAAAPRLCPHCANSIAEDASQCPYCKAELEAEPSPEWLIRDEAPEEIRLARATGERSATPKIVLVAGLILCALAGVMLGMGILGSDESSDVRRLLNEKSKQLLAKDDQLKEMGTELAKVRDQAEISAKEAASLKARLEESQRKMASTEQRQSKEEVALRAQLEESQRKLSLTEQRLAIVNRQLERIVNARRAQVEPRTEARPAERIASPPPRSRPAAEPGIYETIRITDVHRQPSASSPVISRIDKGTRLNVVRSHGEWLEVISRRGNPPGFVRSDDAAFVRASG